METRQTEVEGVRMRWAEQGDGPPVVLIHGIPTSPALWRSVAPKIGQGRILAWEMVGYGDSIPEGHERDISLSKQADYLHSWMRALELDRAVLVGHDLGGGVAQIAAVRYPELCSGLVLINSVSYDSWPIPAVKAMRAASALAARMPLPLLKATLDRVLFARGHDNVDIERESFDVHWGPYAKHGGARALVREIESLDVMDTERVQDDLRSLRGSPARVVWGAADQFQKLRYGKRLAEDLDCLLIPIEGGKHFVPEDHPDIVAAAIDDVVGEAAAAPASPA